MLCNFYSENTYYDFDYFTINKAVDIYPDQCRRHEFNMVGRGRANSPKYYFQSYPKTMMVIIFPPIQIDIPKVTETA